MVLILAFSGAGVGGNDPQESAITLPGVNLDAGSGASQTLLDALNQGGRIQCELYDEKQAEAWLDRGKIKRLLTIPANCAAELQAGHPVTLHLVNAPNASETTTEAVHRAMASVTADLSLQTQLIASFRQMGNMQAAASLEQQAFTTDLIVEQAQGQFERSRMEPLLGVEEIWPQHLLKEDIGV